MEMIVAYMSGMILLAGMFAWRVPHEDIRVVFSLAALWPLSVVAIVGMMIISAAGWDMNVGSNDKMFGFRKPGNPEIKGFAITAFTVELQFFKVTK